jgi:hypothetical protein
VEDQVKGCYVVSQIESWPIDKRGGEEVDEERWRVWGVADAAQLIVELDTCGFACEGKGIDVFGDEDGVFPRIGETAASPLFPDFPFVVV